MAKHRYAFTLIELIVVISIVAVLLCLTLGAIQRARALAERASCQSHLQQITLAIHSYVADHEAYPVVIPSESVSYAQWPYSASFLQWRVHILPYIEQNALFAQAMHASQVEWRADRIPPHTPAQVVVPTFVCPSDWRVEVPQLTSSGQRLGLTSYLGVSGRQIATFPETDNAYRGIFYRSANRPSVRSQDVTDGLAYTLLIGERPPPPSFDAGWWYTGLLSVGSPTQYGPNDALCLDAPSASDPICIACFGAGSISNEADRFHFWSLHLGGANFAFADGSVRYLPYSAAQRMLPLATMAAGEPVELD